MLSSTCGRSCNLRDETTKWSKQWPTAGDLDTWQNFHRLLLSIVSLTMPVKLLDCKGFLHAMLWNILLQNTASRNLLMHSCTCRVPELLFHSFTLLSRSNLFEVGGEPSLPHPYFMATSQNLALWPSHLQRKHVSGWPYLQELLRWFSLPQ